MTETETATAERVRVANATRGRKAANAEWAAAIVAAAAAGIAARAIAKDAGVTHARVLQIVKASREHGERRQHERRATTA
jgi:transposase